MTERQHPFGIIFFLTVGFAASMSSAASAQTQAETAPQESHLVIGDSMAWALGNGLKALADKDGSAKVRTSSKISGTIRAFARGKRVQKALRRRKYSKVILVLGTNDSLVPYPERLTRYVKEVVASVEGHECYWVGPPMWREDTGIVEVIRREAGHCAFFDSSDLVLERRRDKIHPSRKGAEQWAEAVHLWIKDVDAKKKGEHATSDDEGAPTTADTEDTKIEPGRNKSGG